MKFVLIFLTFCFALPAFSQSNDWVQQLGGTGMDFSDAVIIDDAGNIFSTGFYRQAGFTIEGQVLPHVDNMDSYFAKFNSAGTLQWVIPLYGTGVFDRAEALQLDDEGNVYLLSNIQEALMIGTQQSIDNPVDNGIDMLLMKFDTDGQLLWHKIFGGLGSEIGYNMLRHEDNLLLVGHFSDTLHIGDITLTSGGGLDMFIASLDLEGNPQWAKGYGGEENDRLYKVEVHEDGTIGVCGYSTGVWTFGDTPLEAGSGTHQGFIGKVSSSGEPLWASQILHQDALNSQIWALAIDDEGNTYAATNLQGRNKIGSMTFDAEGQFQFALLKYDVDGAVDWIHVSDRNNSPFNGLAAAVRYHDDKIWVTGGLGKDMTLFGKAYPALGNTNFYLAAVDKAGNLVSDFYHADTGHSECWGFALAGDKGVFSLWVKGAVQIDGTVYTTQDYDILLTKMDLSSTVPVDDPYAMTSAPRLYPNPVQNRMAIEVKGQLFSQMEIIDAQGQVLMHMPMLDKIELGHLQAGTYYIRFSEMKHAFVRKFVKL